MLGTLLLTLPGVPWGYFPKEKGLGCMGFDKWSGGF
jgi:hypothetical protein